MRVVVAEDEVLLRDGLVLLLERAGFTAVAAVGDGDALVAAVVRHRPDVVVTDIRMPPTRTDEGLQAALSVRRSLPGTPVVVLSQHLSRRYAEELLGDGAGGVGYLWKQRVSDSDRFVADVRTVAAGGTVLDPDLVAAALDRADALHDSLAELTSRQREVLALVAQGMSNAAIAATLFITQKSVVEHVSRVYDVLQLPQTGGEHRRVLAVLRYLTRRDPGIAP